MNGYTVSSVRETAAGYVMFEVVTDSLQRLYVSMRREQTTAENIDATITHAIAGLYAKPSPVL